MKVNKWVFPLIGLLFGMILTSQIKNENMGTAVLILGGAMLLFALAGNPAAETV